MLTYLFLLFHFISSNAQTPAVAAQGIIHPTTNFRPNLAVVVGILSTILFLTFILLLYAKFCHWASLGNPNDEINDGLLQSSIGLDKRVIESLPFFRFSSLKGLRQGLECAVCLSEFEDIEVLRLLPKCKHAFHIDCIDQWLGKHSTCPLCRLSVTPDDVSLSPYSDSLRLLWMNQTDLREESGVELFVEREESPHGSSRFCVGSSFRKLKNDDDDQTKQALHKIIDSDIVFQSRWSSMSSSDLVFLKSEMLNQFSSSRFSSSTSDDQKLKWMRENDEMMNIKEEMERKRWLEDKVREMNRIDDPNSLLKSSLPSHNIDKRSMSEIIVHPRSTDQMSNTTKEERMRMLWLPIARKTIHWVENRERGLPNHQS